MVARHKAVVSLGQRATKMFDGPIHLGGVGNSQVISKQGIFQVNLPLANERDAKLNGVCLSKITQTFFLGYSSQVLSGWKKSSGTSKGFSVFGR